jgi:DNA-directed RNA polymerase subunit beta'
MLKDFSAIQIKIASPQDILSWSYGEVTKPETINYRTFRPEPGGLMAEEIFGPTQDFVCYCGKYKKVRYKGVVCDRCGVEVTHRRVRRERMGHITLAAPVCHVWFSHGVPNKLSIILDIPAKNLETIIYYSRYAVISVDEERRQSVLDNLQNILEDEEKYILEELEQKINELRLEAENDIANLRKDASISEDKLNMQLERINTHLNRDIAKLKAAYDQKIGEIEDKFTRMKTLIEEMTVGTTLSEEDHSMFDYYGINFFEAQMGAEAIKKLLEQINIDETIKKLEEEFQQVKSDVKKSKLIQRIKLFKNLKRSKINPSWIVLEVLPVIPPDLRPIVQLPGGRFATYDLNDLYRRVINRNNRLKRLISLGAPEIILRNEKRMLQEAVDALFDNSHRIGSPALNSRQMPFKSLSDMLRGKQGRFRQNLLGKRVDYAGNAVIVSGPELNFDQCGLPKAIALEIFKPFVIRELILRGHATNPARARILFEERIPVVWDILEDVVKGRPVILNRAPTLHKQSLLAFYPVLIDGSAIQLHPMVCKGFNADFDGDQMAVHLPLSDKAVEEVKERMFVKYNMLNMGNASPIVNVEKDMAVGIYVLTKLNEKDERAYQFAFSDVDEAIRAYHDGQIKYDTPIKLLVNGEVLNSSAGRCIFNKVLPSDFGFVNKPLTKSDISKLTAELFDRYGRDIAISVLDLIKELGFKFAYYSGFSISIFDFNFGAESIISKYMDEYREEESKLFSLYLDGFMTANELRWENRELWEKYSGKIQDEVWEKSLQVAYNLADLINSGGLAGAKTWIERICAVHGFGTDVRGETVDLPLMNNFYKGFTNFEYFVASRSARKGFADTALKTADSGYLTRRLVEVCHDVITTEYDCGTEDGIYVYKSDKRQIEFYKRIRGRFACEDVIDSDTGEVIIKKGMVITPDLAKRVDKIDKIDKVKVRSPLKCKTVHGICTKCYGYDNGTSKVVDIGEAVGVIAAQSLGEPTTQLTLQSKSTARGTKVDVTKGFPRLEELVEARTPKSKAVLADIDGYVSIVESQKGTLLRIQNDVKVVKRFEIRSSKDVLVNNGSKVSIGTPIINLEGKIIKSQLEGILTIDDNQVIVEGMKHIETEKDLGSNYVLLVKDGDYVTKGQQLTFGSIDPKELAVYLDFDAAQRYLISEMQEVYGTYGISIDDRHIEIVVKQMSRFGIVTDGGDSEIYFTGDCVNILELENENKNLKEMNKKLMKYERVLFGITNASLRTESFLSAASFEQQVRVLSDAALAGKIDYLRGLKENVIIGKLVPLGKVLKEKLNLLNQDNPINE